MENLSFLDLRKLSKKSSAKEGAIKLAIVGDSATQLLRQGIQGACVYYNLNVSIYEEDYDQMDMALLVDESSLLSFKPDYILIFNSSEKAFKEYLKCSFSQKPEFSQNTESKHRSYVDSITAKLPKTKILITNYPEKTDLLFHNYGNSTTHSWIYQIRKLNMALMDLSINSGNVFIVDIANLIHYWGRGFSFDPKVYIKSDIITSLDILPKICLQVGNFIKTLEGHFNKCLILDLDNTIWGGIIGDDGMEKIQIGSFGIGKAFCELQLWAKNLKERGVILAICSKNDETIAMQPFLNHPDMILRIEDISVFVANWENKADNIRTIQSVLNIGFDSMVFLDDNPFERNLIRELLPEVNVPEMPVDPSEYLTFLETLNLFETNSFTQLDNTRTIKYQEETKRKKSEASFNSITDFLSSLNMKATISPFNAFNKPRVAQLSQRSNQFNLRTVRYQESDIDLIINSKKHQTFAISLQDKFGDYGIISILILKQLDSESWFVDTWIMSCRVLKRDIEKFVLNQIVLSLRNAGAKKLIGERLATKKNELVKDHYLNLGFTKNAERWSLSIDNYNIFKTEIDLHE